MLERDVRQVNDRRVEDVRRVEPAAEPGLDRGDVDSLRGELGQRGSRQRLELRRSQPLGRRPHSADGTLEALGVGVEPLLPAGDVRRRVRADAQPFPPQQLGDRPRGCGLAVRAHDMDARERPLRVAELFEQLAHATEAELLRPRRERRDPGCMRVHRREC